MTPTADAFSRRWPAAHTTNLLDDSLSADLRDSGTLNARMMARFASLGRYVVDNGSDAILFTCSAFGPAIEAVQREHAPLPVLKPNEAMFEEALANGRAFGMVATFAPSIAAMAAEFAELAGAAGNAASLRSVCAEGAMDALATGDGMTHDRLIAEAAGSLADCDVIMLAQFSMARAQSAVATAVGTRPVLTSPDSAVRHLKTMLS